MAQDLLRIENSNEVDYDPYSNNRLIRIAIPTNCKEDTVPEISSLLKLMGCSAWVTFVHVVPFESNEFSDCLGSEDLRYAMSIAEMKLYSFIKKFERSSDVMFDYKVVTGNPVGAILDVVKKGKFDVLAVKMGDISHLDPEFSNGIDLISRSEIPVIVFGGKTEKYGRDNEGREGR